MLKNAPMDKIKYNIKVVYCIFFINYPSLQFLIANKNNTLINEIKKCYNNNKPMDNVLHEKALALYRLYLCVEECQKP